MSAVNNISLPSHPVGNSFTGGIAPGKIYTKQEQQYHEASYKTSPPPGKVTFLSEG